MGRGRRGGRSEEVRSGAARAEDSEKREPAPTPALLNFDQTPETSSFTPNSTMGLQPRKKQKREEYRASLQQDARSAVTGSAELQLPKKKWFRQRAHANPFSDHQLAYPIGPGQMDWSRHFPTFIDDGPKGDDANSDIFNEAEAAEKSSEQELPKLVKNVEIADIGCGFGGLLFALAPARPETLMLGLEIRTSVTEFVENKIRVLRQQQLSNHNPSVPPNSAETLVPGGYQNVSVVRTNSMKFLPNFFPKASLKTIFLCFPDPHFKSRKHKARIVSSTLNSEYAYVLREGGYVATITDVEELSEWMAQRFDGHESFERVAVDESVVDENVVDDDEKEARWLIKMMKESTEEGKKVDRFKGNKFVGVWKRVRNPAWPGE